MGKLDIHQKYKFSKNKGLSGLSNLGNTCFMNSVLQCLSNSLPLTQHLLTININAELNTLIKMYIKLLFEIWKENSPLAPKSFKTCLNVTLPKYNNNLQHDAHEFLLEFMEILHDNLSNSIRNVEFEINPNSNKYVQQASKSWNKYIKNKSIISELFYGQFMKIFSCNSCYYTFRKYEPFISLDLPCVKNNDNISNCVKKYFDKDYHYFSCMKCNKDGIDVEHQVDTTIFRLPEILIISLKRFTVIKQQYVKNLNTIILNDTLDLSDFSSISTDTSVIYDIKSIICHTGKTLESGHYFTLIRNKDNWNYFNDHQIYYNFDITKLDLSYPYILFYERRC